MYAISLYIDAGATGNYPVTCDRRALLEILRIVDESGGLVGYNWLLDLKGDAAPEFYHEGHIRQDDPLAAIDRAIAEAAGKDAALLGRLRAIVGRLDPVAPGGDPEICQESLEGDAR